MNPKQEFGVKEKVAMATVVIGLVAAMIGLVAQGIGLWLAVHPH